MNTGSVVAASSTALLIVYSKVDYSNVDFLSSLKFAHLEFVRLPRQIRRLL